MSLWDHPEAQALLNNAELTSQAVEDWEGRWTGFLNRDWPLFYRVEHRRDATLVIGGLLSGLERKTRAPIAIEAGGPRKPIPFFVDAGQWDDEAVIAESRIHVREELAEPQGVVVVDPSGFPKKGTESRGVARQWCGRLGQLDNCPVGVFLAAAGSKGDAPLDRRLFLPEAWADDPARREKGHVPPEGTFQEPWPIALALRDRSLPDLPHGGITGDEEFGRAWPFRVARRPRQERHVLDVPCDTLVRDLERRRPRRRHAGRGREREVPFPRVDAWAASQPASRWVRLTVRDDAKGPLQVDAMTVRVRAKPAGRSARPRRAADRDAIGGRDADRRRLEQRRRRDFPGRAGGRPASEAPRGGAVRGRRRCGGAGS